MSQELSEFIKQFPVVFASIVGFGGVILTLLANAWMQRRQHKRQVNHDRNAVRAALKTELKFNLNAFERRIEQLSDAKDGKHALVPSRLINEVYSELIGKLGLLNSAEIENVVGAYLLIAEVPYRLRILVGAENTGGSNGEFIRLHPQHIETALGIHKIVLPKISEALQPLNA